MSAASDLEVVICTYNNAGMLDGVLATLASQAPVANGRWSCLVVDNNCTDGTPEVVRRYAAAGKIPGLRSVRETKQGLTPARLCGVRSSTAPWIAFVDDDCFLRSDWIAQALAFAEKRPAAGAFGGKVVLEFDVEPPPYVRAFSYCFAEQQRGDVECEVPFLAGAGLVVNRAALCACGWTDGPLLADRVGKSLVSGGDVEIVLRISGAGYQLWYLPQCELRHHIPAQRTSPRYLVAINRNLGVSQSLGDALAFEGTLSQWLRQAALTAARQLFTLPRLALRMVRRPNLRDDARSEARIQASFQLGRLQGLWRILTMPPSRRRNLLGCSHRPPRHHATPQRELA